MLQDQEYPFDQLRREVLTRLLPSEPLFAQQFYSVFNPLTPSVLQNTSIHLSFGPFEQVRVESLLRVQGFSESGYIQIGQSYLKGHPKSFLFVRLKR